MRMNTDLSDEADSIKRFMNWSHISLSRKLVKYNMLYWHPSGGHAGPHGLSAISIGFFHQSFLLVLYLLMLQLPTRREVKCWSDWRKSLAEYKYVWIYYSCKTYLDESIGRPKRLNWKMKFVDICISEKIISQPVHKKVWWQKTYLCLTHSSIILRSRSFSTADILGCSPQNLSEVPIARIPIVSFILDPAWERYTQNMIGRGQFW